MTGAVPGLSAALRAAAPGVDQSVWLEPLSTALLRCNVWTPRRVAAFVGQCSVEAGTDFHEVGENLFYTTAARLRAVWPSRFATEADAAPYLRAPEMLANHVYAGKLGNGDAASGDGWRFRGGGLLQLTGRAEYGAFGTARGMSAEAAVSWVQTPAGAADAAAWYWQTHGCNDLADSWRISQITRAINGPAMLDNDKRIAASNAALRAIG